MITISLPSSECSVISTISRVGEVPDIASCARIELAKSGTRNCDGEALIVRNPCFPDSANRSRAS